MNTAPTIRAAKEEDCSLVLHFIKQIAAYENMSDDVIASEQLLHEYLFVKQRAEVIFVMEEGKEVGFALFFYNFSTFLGRSGMYLEDLYVEEAYRGRGYGKALLQELARLAIERQCGRLEWCCLNWNQPSIDFYLSLGAEPMSEWTTYRLSGTNLSALAQSQQ